MAITQAKLESKLWDAANALRGAMDAADYKNYVFPVLFWKWISDNWELEHQKFLADVEGQELDEASLAEVEADYHIFTVPDGTRWSQIFRNEDVPADIAEDKTHKLNPSTYLGIRVKHAMDLIAQSNSDRLANIFGDVHYANQERLPESALIGLLKPFDEVSLDRENAPGDLMGAAYEYLLKRFADDAGQKAGEFFTPRSVVHLITRLLKPQENETVYDPTSGTGGMLIESVAAVEADGGDARTLSLYGQEKNLTTQSIARMNMYIHNLPDHNIMRGDTLREPKFTERDALKKFDVVIANPPFSVSDWGVEKWKGDKVLGDTPPNSYADLAFLQHMIASMKPETGRIGVVMPHGVLFRGHAEQRIREAIIRKDLIEAVIGLPNKIFYGTGIPSCLLILRAKKSEERKNKILFVDASSRFEKGKNMNLFRDSDVKAILKAFHEEKDVDGAGQGIEFASIGLEEVKKNNYDLTIGRYVAANTDVEIDTETALAEFTESVIAADKSRATMLDLLKGAGFDV